MRTYFTCPVLGLYRLRSYLQLCFAIFLVDMCDTMCLPHLHTRYHTHDVLSRIEGSLGFPLSSASLAFWLSRLSEPLRWCQSRFLWLPHFRALFAVVVGGSAPWLPL